MRVLELGEELCRNWILKGELGRVVIYICDRVVENEESVFVIGC